VPTVKQHVHVNLYQLISDAVERGLEIGWRRAHKHTETPDPQHVQQQQHDEIMNQLSEFVVFNEEE